MPVKWEVDGGESVACSVSPVPDVVWLLADKRFSFAAPALGREIKKNLPYCLVWSPELGEYQIPFDPETEQIEMGTGFTVPWELNSARRLWEAHPSRYGLVPHSQPGIRGWVGIPSRDAARTLSGVVDPMLLPSWVRDSREGEGVGWFPSSANPDEAGVQFLALRAYPSGLVWCRYVVGVDGVVEKIQWNDVERMRAATFDVLTQIPANVMVEQALLDSEAVRLGQVRRIHAVNTRRARLEFANPRYHLSSTEVALVVKQVADEWRDGVGCGRRIPSSEPGLGWQLLQRAVSVLPDGLPNSPQAPSLSVGVLVYVLPSSARSVQGKMKECREDDVVVWAAERLRVLLREGDLGRVVRVRMPRLGAMSILVTKRPELVEVFPAAFGLPAGSDIHVLEP